MTGYKINEESIIFLAFEGEDRINSVNLFVFIFLQALSINVEI